MMMENTEIKQNLAGSNLGHILCGFFCGWALNADNPLGPMIVGIICGLGGWYFSDKVYKALN